MKLFAKKTKDERIVAESNKVYKIAYLVMTFGILFDLFLQFTGLSFDGKEQFSARPVEFAVFMLAQIICLVLMLRKGFMDDNRFAEAEVFPHRHYLLLALGSGAAAGLLFCVLRMLAFPYWEFGAQAFFFVMGTIFLVVALSCAVLIYAMMYLCFRVARRRRRALAARFEDEE